MAVESFWRVARRPKWIGALLAALAMAAIFALLSQWQLDRSFRTVGQTATEQQSYVPIQTLVKPGQSFPERADGRLVTFTGTANAGEPVLVANRLQNGKAGYWLVIDFFEDNADAELPVAVAWFKSERSAKAALDEYQTTAWASFIQTSRGRLLGPEAPQPARRADGALILNSLSTAQLANIYLDESPAPFYSAVVALSDYRDSFVADLIAANGGQSIQIGTQEKSVELNFLNIFYALEWVVFAGFAIFMWWRLVQDERLGLRAPEGKLDE